MSHRKERDPKVGIKNELGIPRYQRFPTGLFEGENSTLAQFGGSYGHMTIENSHV